MPLFTEEHLQELEALFTIKRNTELLPVRDGYVAKGDRVYWRNFEGPEIVIAKDHWDNIHGYPDGYSIKRPMVTVSYKD